MKNKILIITTVKYWVGISRLPAGLDRAGFIVNALTIKESYLSATKHLSGSIFYKAKTYSRTKLFYFIVLYSYIKFKPDFIIPGDEESIFVMQNLRTFFQKIPLFKNFVNTLNSSLPSSEFDEMIFSKSIFLNNCKTWNVITPQSKQVTHLEEALQFANEIGFPVVLKLDSGYGGSGVFICQNSEELQKQFKINHQYSLLTKIKFKIKNIFFISILNHELNISVQQFIKGLPGHVSFCAFKGNLLGANPMLALKTFPEGIGPSSVSTGFNNLELIKYAQIITEKISYNGFGSLDFMYDEITKQVYVIELNARPTPPCHFSDSVVPNDLCSLFFKAFNDQQITLNKFRSYTVAMYPNEQNRDINSPYLKEAYHDIPENDESLKLALLKSPTS